MSTWLITGCSSGLGRALAQALLDHGHNVAATARDVTRVADLAEAHPERALALALDVTDGAAVARAVQQTEQRFGGLDVLVNNAGYGYRAAVEEGDDDDVQQLFATNFFGAVSMTRAVLPGMRARRRGAIVNISSIGARICPAGSGYYSATKGALEGLTGSLRRELEPLGLHAMIVEPGAFRTDFSGRSLRQAETPIGDYADTAGRRRKENDTTHGTEPGDPAKAAEAIIVAVGSASPPALLVLGQDAVTLFRDTLEAQLADLAEWEKTSVATAVDA
ncbi:oxidoreductase [Parafrankia elaeagni]|uniref:oxidoreductase n=1 Tax=Parafrankia elaeagni TaxID=222534 RepID=UPI000367E287|nr:oxidoreductase [Parafrankia elaeagni]